MLRTSRQRFATFALACAAVLALAACGSSSKASVTPGARADGLADDGAGQDRRVARRHDIGDDGARHDPRRRQRHDPVHAHEQRRARALHRTVRDVLAAAHAGDRNDEGLGRRGGVGLGTVKIAGGLQVTDNGDPLYRFSVDKAPGDSKGEGISSFGGTWHVVATTAKSSTATTVDSSATMPPADRARRRHRRRRRTRTGTEAQRVSRVPVRSARWGMWRTASSVG